MDWFMEFLKRTPEYQNFGWNALFISSAGTVVLTLFQAYGLCKQGERIWKTKSAASVSFVFMGYSMFYFLAFLVYGIKQLSIAIICNGALSIFYIPIILGTSKFKWITGKEIFLLLLFTCMPVPFFYFGKKVQDIVLMAYLVGVIITLIQQTDETLNWSQTGKLIGIPSSLDQKFLVAFMVTNVFWFVYAWFTKNWPLVIFNPISFMFMGTNLMLIRKKPEKKESFCISCKSFNKE